MEIMNERFFKNRSKQYNPELMMNDKRLPRGWIEVADRFSNFYLDLDLGSTLQWNNAFEYKGSIKTCCRHKGIDYELTETLDIIFQHMIKNKITLEKFLIVKGYKKKNHENLS